MSIVTFIGLPKNDPLKVYSKKEIETDSFLKDRIKDVEIAVLSDLRLAPFFNHTPVV